MGLPRYTDEDLDRDIDEMLDSNPETAWKNKCRKAILAKLKTQEHLTSRERSRLKYWQKWYADQREEHCTEMHDSAMEAYDPYSYYGVRRSDF